MCVFTESFVSDLCYKQNKIKGLYEFYNKNYKKIIFDFDNDLIYIGHDKEIVLSKANLNDIHEI